MPNGWLFPLYNPPFFSQHKTGQTQVLPPPLRCFCTTVYIYGRYFHMLGVIKFISVIKTKK